MMITAPPMGFNTWNTFGKDINEKLIKEIADAMVEKGYRDAGYEYLVIDDCWHLPERHDGKMVADPEKFPGGIKALADYIHSKGLKFGMYSSSGVLTCEHLPGSFGYEYTDAKQFAEWGIDYLKYDYCHFPASADTKTAYLRMKMALKSCGRDILFAACNWGEKNASDWMRSHGADIFRSTQDIHDNRRSFCDIFVSQIQEIEKSGCGCFNDMDMLIVGMHGEGNVGLGGCTSEEYAMHFAMWAFMGSPLMIGGDIRSMNAEDEKILLNKNLISINQDSYARPPFLVGSGGNFDGSHNIRPVMMRLLSDNKFAIAIFNIESDGYTNLAIPFEDLGIPANGKVHFTDAVTGEDLGVSEGSFLAEVQPMQYRVVIGEI